jgi:hypothetical protein
MPCPLDSVSIRRDNPHQLAKSAGVITIIVGHVNFRMQPEFRFLIIFLNVNVHRFARRSFVRIEEESEATLTKSYWHSNILLHFRPNNTHLEHQSNGSDALEPPVSEVEWVSL